MSEGSDNVGNSGDERDLPKLMSLTLMTSSRVHMMMVIAPRPAFDSSYELNDVGCFYPGNTNVKLSNK